MRRAIILLAAVCLLTTPVWAVAQPASLAPSSVFTRGQWTQYGSGNLNGALWRSNGTTDTDVNGNVIPSGDGTGSTVKGSLCNWLFDGGMSANGGDQACVGGAGDPQD